MTSHELERVIAYHRITKHAPGRYARSLGYMDWDTQPDPFRRFDGAPRVELPLRADALRTKYAELYEPGAVAPHPLGIDGVATFFELALGLTAWKGYGESRWSLRADPSSGNLHPTEAYAVLPSIAGVLDAGVFHYLSHDHCLEQRARVAPDR
ncbi:MAG: nitroreductase, partial [Planctomycetes bacterium]|nr:nitroreductase [Planctomycetota bacterium]